jgi:hypothetical protein
LEKLDPAPTKNRSVVGLRVQFQIEKVVKESDGREDTKEGFAKMYKDMSKKRRK